MKALNRWHLGLAMVVCLAALPLEVPAQGISHLDEETPLKALSADSLKARIKAQKARTLENPKNAAEHHALARLYMAQGTVLSRQDARGVLRRLVRQHPEEPAYRITFAELFWIMGRVDEAFDQAKRTLKLDSDYLPGLYWAGKAAAREMTLTLERMTLGTASIFSFEEYGKRKREEAIGYLTRALKVDREHRPSRILLGMVYYEGGRPEELVALFEAYMKRHPEDWDAAFFVGLGYQAQDDLPAAYAAYAEALDRMSEAERRFLGAIFMLTERAEQEGVEDGALWKFWAVRDPLFLTQVNERLMDQCSRVAYANLRFGDPLKGIEGWRTEKGQAYIRYGKPVSRTLYMGWTDVNLKEVWAYPDFRIQFINTTPDHWRVEFAQIGALRVGSLKGLTRRVPEYYEDLYWWERYDMPCQMAQFRGEDNRTRVEVYYALPGEQVDHHKAGPGLRRVDLRHGLFLFNADRDPIRKEVGQVQRLPWVTDGTVQSGYLFCVEELMLAPGGYYLSLEMEDQKTKTLGSFRDSLHIKAFGVDSLEVSDLLLARRIVEREEEAGGRERFRILPNPLGRCTQRTAAFYFEVYNLVRDAFGATHYRVAYQVRMLPEGTGGNLSEPDWTTAVSHTYRGMRPWEAHVINLGLEGSTSGLRAFQVMVDDLLGEQQAIASTVFRVRW